MPLNNTTILPSDSPEEAEQLFKSLIDEKDVVCVIVFGNDSVAQTAIKNADVRAALSPAGFKRRAVWMQSTGLWDNVKSYLKNGAVKVNSIDPANLIAIGVSLSDKVEMEMPTSKTPDFIAMEFAFVTSSKQ